jgi:hypothetical protein
MAVIRICSIKGCGGPYYCRNYCCKHYYRWKKHGDPLTLLQHRMSCTPTWRSWKSMVDRCTNPNFHWEQYGGRGITVCSQWLLPDGVGFKNFFADMGERPEGTSIDRWPNPNGNYEPGNCQWSTPAQQVRHTGPQKKSTSRFKGVSWCTEMGALGCADSSQ